MRHVSVRFGQLLIDVERNNEYFATARCEVPHWRSHVFSMLVAGQRESSDLQPLQTVGGPQITGFLFHVHLFGFLNG